MDSTKILDESSPEVQYLCSKDKRLAKVISMVGRIEYTLPLDPYIFLLHEIIEQMLSIKAGQKIFNRLSDLCAGTITPDKIDSLSEEVIHSIGTSTNKARCIKEITHAIQHGQLSLTDLSTKTDSEVISTLTNFKGIGNWTAKMYLIFVLERNDILPFEDGAFLQSYRWMYKTTETHRTSVEHRCKKWRPYSSIAARYLYRALDMGFTKQEFHLFK